MPLMKRGLAGVVLAAAVALCAIAPAAAQDVLRPDWSNVADEIRPLVAGLMERDGLKGAMIALVDGDDAVWTEGFGYADAAGYRRVDADTMFEIGSVSKTFTGIMVMRLADEGKLDIDAPVTDYIPEFRMLPPALPYPRNDRPVTVRDMMDHHSGIPGDLFNGSFGVDFDPDFLDKALAWLARDSATYPPGYRWAYSNTAVALLARVIEAASGKSFEEYSQGFLDSLGMAPASYYKKDPALLARLSKPYAEGGEMPMTQLSVPASGTICASANNMARYLRMLLGKGGLDGKAFVKPESFGEMLTPQNADVALDFYPAIGLSFLLDDPALNWAGKLFWHNGETVCFNSHMEVLPDHGLGVFVSVNTQEGMAAAAEIAKTTLATALRLKRGQVPPQASAAATGDALRRAALPARMLENLAGTYVSDDQGRYMLVTATPEGLSMTTVYHPDSGGRLPAKVLYPWSDGLFRTAADSTDAIEFMEASGAFVATMDFGGARYFFGERYAPRAIPAAWTARLGDWDSADRASYEAGTNFGTVPEISLAVMDGMLVMLREGRVLVLDPVSDDVAAVRGMGRIGGASARVVAENGTEKIRFMMDIYSRR